LNTATPICVVDDDEAVRMSLKSFLRSTGTPVLTFPSAEAFLGEMAQNNVKCLITDLHMPGMDGLALQQELNRQGYRYPVIVMTAYPTEAAKEAATRLGAAAFMAKPVDPDILLECLEALLNRTRRD
jgi:FixJ family two-component response regulator